MSSDRVSIKLSFASMSPFEDRVRLNHGERQATLSKVLYTAAHTLHGVVNCWGILGINDQLWPHAQFGYIPDIMAPPPFIRLANQTDFEYAADHWEGARMRSNLLWHDMMWHYGGTIVGVAEFTANIFEMTSPESRVKLTGLEDLVDEYKLSKVKFEVYRNEE